ncbi:MAG: BatD family protein [Bdellovibrionales bacterium]|nr:BatD family protein [Bdellovibrionales bacterium]
MIVLLLPTVVLGAPFVHVEVSPENGSRYDTFQFSVIVTGEAKSGAPQLTGGDDFDLEYAGSSSNIQILNGAASIEARYVYNLTPKKSGALLTPGVEVNTPSGTVTAEPVRIQVSETPSANSGNNDSNIFLKRKFSSTRVYEGEQFITTLQLYSRYRVEKGDFDDLLYEKFWKEDIRKPTVDEVRYQGVPYTRHEIQHALYPLQAGTITLPPAVLKLAVRKPQQSNSLSRFRLFDPDFFQFDSLETHTVVSEPAEIEVLPLPQIPADLRGTYANDHVIVGKLDVSLGYDTSSIERGTGKTIIVTLKSTGNIHPLNSLSLHTPSWVRTYADQPEEKRSLERGQVVIEKTFRMSLVPEKGGAVSIPGVSFLVFDPESQSYRVEETRPISFDVTGQESDEAVIPEESESVSEPAVTSSPSERVVYRYREENLLEVLSRSISTSLALLLLAGVLFILGTFYFALKLFAARENGISTKLSKELSESATISALRERFLERLSEGFGESDLTLRGQALSEKIKECVTDEGHRVTLERYLDSLNALAFGGEEEDQTTIASLRKEGSEILAQLFS